MPLLSVDSLETTYHTPHGALRAVDDVSLHIDPGETLALVGDSGCGKSTLGKSILGLVSPSAGAVRINEREISALKGWALQPFPRQIQMVFQDPSASLNPRHTVGTLLSTPLRVHRVRGRT